MIKDIPIQYVTDEAGNKQAVVIPFDEWLKIQKELTELREYYALKESLTRAFKEVDQIKRGNEPRTTLSEFLNEG